LGTTPATGSTSLATHDGDASGERIPHFEDILYLIDCSQLPFNSILLAFS
jgi:hypothetical protein